MKTNLEEYKDVILKYKGDIMVDKNTRVVSGCDFTCSSCFFNNDHLGCGKLIRSWLFEEYKPKPKHKLYQHELDVLEWLVDEFDASMISWTYKQLGQNWFNGVVDIDNVTIEEIFSNYELIE